MRGAQCVATIKMPACEHRRIGRVLFLLVCCRHCAPCTHCSVAAIYRVIRASTALQQPHKHTATEQMAAPTSQRPTSCRAPAASTAQPGCGTQRA